MKADQHSGRSSNGGARSANAGDAGDREGNCAPVANLEIEVRYRHEVPVLRSLVATWNDSIRMPRQGDETTAGRGQVGVHPMHVGIGNEQGRGCSPRGGSLFGGYYKTMVETPGRLRVRGQINEIESVLRDRLDLTEVVHGPILPVCLFGNSDRVDGPSAHSATPSPCPREPGNPKYASACAHTASASA